MGTKESGNWIDPVALAKAIVEPDHIIVVPVDGVDTPVRVGQIGPMLSLLRELEWVTWGDDGPSFTTCPKCDVHKPGPHSPDCRLPQLLEGLRG